MSGAGPDSPLDPATRALLSAVLGLDPSIAAEIRTRTPARRRPQRQAGPVLDLGGEDGGAGPSPGQPCGASRNTDGTAPAR